MKNRKGWKKGFLVTLSVLLIVLTPGTALAAQTAANLRELAEIVTEEAVARNSEFEVEYTGNKADVKPLADYEQLIYFLDGLALLDDPLTPVDADYISGNVNIGSDDLNCFISGKTLSFSIPFFESQEQTSFVNQTVPRVVSELGVSYMRNYEKVKTIHDYVCDLITYTDDVDNCSTAYSALKNGLGLCNSYALTMYRLLIEAGVPCKYIGGVAGTGRDSGGHAWNIVALGDKWYYLDATWDDPDGDGEISYDYFLKGNSDFDEADPSQAHKMDPPYLTADFVKQFPIANTAFDPYTMDDMNYTVKIGDSEYPVNPVDPEPVDPDPSDPSGETYALDDIVDYTYPEDGYFTAKKGKMTELQLVLKPGMEDLIEDVDYEIYAGKKRIKKADIGIYEDEDYGDVFVDMEFKGKKKGLVGIVIYLYLTNGQTLECEFEGKIK